MAISMLKDNQRFVAGAADNCIKVYTVQAAKALHSMQCGPSALSCLQVYSEAPLLQILVATWDSVIQLWDTSQQKTLNSCCGHQKVVTAMALTAGAGQDICLVSGGQDALVKVWDLPGCTCIRSLSGHKAAVTSVCVSQPDHALIVSGSQDCTIKIWGWEKGVVLRTLEGHKNFVSRVLITADQTSIISASFDQTIRHWELEWRGSGHFCGVHSCEKEESLPQTCVVITRDSK